jgi:hypothetical protein
MKFTALLTGITLCSATAFGQMFTINEGSTTDNYQQKQSEELEFTLGGTHYFFTTHYESLQTHYYLQSVGADGSGLTAGKLEIAGGVFNDSYSIREVVGLGDQAYALVEHLDKNNGKKTLTAHKVSASADVAEDGQDVLDFGFEKVMRSGYMHAATSSNHQYMAVVGLLPYNKKEQAKIKVAVYDANLKEVSSSQFEIEGKDMKNKRIEVMVANDGTTYITRFTNKMSEGYRLRVHQYDISSSSVAETYEVSAGDNNRIDSYAYGVNEQNELVVAGTYYENKAAVSSGDIPSRNMESVFMFRTKDKSEGIMGKSDIDSPMPAFQVTHILFSGGTTFMVGEVRYEKRETPQNADGTTALTKAYYIYKHRDEYVFGFNDSGEKSFELSVNQNYDTRDFDRQYSSSYHIVNGNLIGIYNDAYSKYRDDNSSAGSSMVPVGILVQPDGLLKPAVPFINELKLSSGYSMNPSLSLSSGNKITTFIRNHQQTKVVTITVNE